MDLRDLIFEQLEVKTLDLPYSREEALWRISRKVKRTKKIPWLLHKRYTGTNSGPYFTGVVNQNKIELLYNPTTNTFIRVSAKISHEFDEKCTLKYSVYRNSEFMALNYYLIAIQLIVLMTWGLSTNGFKEAFLFLAFVTVVLGARIFETHKILFDQKVSTRLKLISFPGIGIISITTLCTLIVLYFLLQDTKVIWQFPLVLIFFFTAFRFLRRFEITNSVEEKFLECFK